ncbi:DNA cytosine methyltransferase [Flavobacterium sp. UW10123]|uniref:DNA cytosine methyltransferase n=1 Tax=Flavobacterium sp. UW10123 TaxID=3230800 RepID=UPI003398E5D6
MEISRLKVVDLFAGCGGLSKGFENAGFNVVAAFDNWDPAIEVYKQNFSHPIIKCDLGDSVNFDHIVKYNPDIIIGGPPCQDFSSAGHRNESLGRAELTNSYFDIIELIKPKYFVMENVPRIQKSQLFNPLIEKFKSLGYGLTQTVIDASLCGVPQQRKRFVLIGEYGANDNFVSDAIENNLANKQMTLHDYFGDSLGFEYYFRVPRSYNRRGIFSIYEPSMTIRGVDRPVPKGYLGHNADPIKLNSSIRTLTVKERSMIQTFPQDFKFIGSKTTVNQIIGNAVPVKLSEFIGNILKSHILNKS